MHTGKGQVVEMILEGGFRLARISCPASLVPAPGQYLLAGGDSDSPLPVPVYYTDSAPFGFIAPAPHSWMPGQEILVRGPLGHGFALPASARRVALVAFDDSPLLLRGLVAPALNRSAAVTMVGDFDFDSLPDDVEIQPKSALGDVLEWAEYAAFDVARENVPQLRERLGRLKQFLAVREAQVLIRAPMPCGGIADCGVCAVTLKSGWGMVCKDGPMFALQDI